jgi:hypothetical protein
MPYVIIQLPNKKFTVMNRVSGHKFSKGSTKKNALAQMRLLQAKAKKLEGGSMMGGTAGDSLLYKSMSDKDLNEYFPHARVLKYNEIPREVPADEFLKEGEVVFILYEAEENTGHWVSLVRAKDCFFYFDSYGNKPDVPLSWNSPETNERLGQSYPTLTKMFSITKQPLYYNDFAYQDKKDTDMATCGRWATSFLIHFKKYGGSLKSFHKEVLTKAKERKLPLDNLISTIITE